MKEVCIDVRMAFSSGIGTYIRNIISGLQDGPFKLRLIADPRAIEKWPLLSKCDLISCSAPIYSIEEQIKLPFLIPRCDLFWSPHYNIPLGPIRAKKRMVTIHDVYHLAFKEQLSFFKRMYAENVIAQAVKQSDLVLTVSQFSQQELHKHVPFSPKAIKAIHLGVDRTHFYPRENFKYDLPEKYLLFVGNLAPHKNVEALLKALSYLDKSWKVVLVGAKKGTNIASHEQAIFLEHVSNEDLPSLYRGAYATVHPSFYEGFGLTPLEAMSCGCPVIVSTAASLPEVCKDAAFYIDPHEPKSIVDAVEALGASRQTWIEKGLKRAKEMSWSRSVQQHIEAIESLL